MIQVYCLVAILIAFIFGVRVGRRIFLPFWEKFSVILSFKTSDEWLRYIDVLAAAGLKPAMFLESPFALRAFYPQGLIIGCHKKIGDARIDDAQAGVVLVKSDPSTAAQGLYDFIRRTFGDPRVGDTVAIEPDSGVGRGSLVLVGNNGLVPRLTGFRRVAIKMGGKRPEGWDRDSVQQAVASFGI